MLIWPFNKSRPAPEAPGSILKASDSTTGANKYSVAVEVAKIQKSLLPSFKAQGFVSSGRVFNRTAADGIVHVIGFQSLRSIPQPYGQFAIEIGVYVPELWEFQQGYCQSGPPKTKNVIDCTFRLRLSADGPGENHCEWQALAHPDQIKSAHDKTMDESKVFFGRFGDLSRVKSWLEGFPDCAPFINSSAPVLLAVFEAKNGNIEGAKKRLAAYSTFLRQQPNRASHVGYVEALINTSDWY